MLPSESFLPGAAGPRPAADEPLRRAALLLHAMAEVDRAWMMGQIAPAHRAAVAGLVAELDALGFPADPALLEESLAGLAANPPRAAAHAGASDRATAVVARFSAAEAHRRLAAEPDALVALVLAAGAWSWESAFLGRLGEARAGAVRALAAAAAPVPAALAEALLAALASSGATDGAPRGPSASHARTAA